MKTVFYIIISLSIFSCSSKTIENTQWYESQVVEQIIMDTDSTYIIQIGIMAQAFHLDKQDEGFSDKLEILKESLSGRTKIDLEVEKGTAKILSVKK
jgi:hypothetical protein